MPRSAKPVGPHRVIPTESIRSGELWPIRLLHERLGWGPRTLAAAKVKGLRILRWSKRAYVKTDDIIAFIEKQAASTKEEVGDRDRPASSSLAVLASPKDGLSNAPVLEAKEPFAALRQTALRLVDAIPRKMLVIHARSQKGGFYLAMVAAAEIEAALTELGIDADQMYEISEWRTTSKNVTVAFVPFPGRS